MTPDLTELRRLAGEATRGEWTAHPDGLVWPERMGDPVSASTEVEDAQWIAAANPQTILSLLDRLEAVSKAAEEVVALDADTELPVNVWIDLTRTACQRLRAALDTGATEAGGRG